MHSYYMYVASFFSMGCIYQLLLNLFLSLYILFLCVKMPSFPSYFSLKILSIVFILSPVLSLFIFIFEVTYYV